MLHPRGAAMSDKRIVKPESTSEHDRLDDVLNGVLENDLDSQVSEGNQRAARGWHTEERPLSKGALKRGRVARH